MNERLAKAEAIFHEALEIPPEQRESFLQQACGEDAELLREVTALLRASGIADEWLSENCAAAAPREGEPPVPPPLGSKVRYFGDYELLEQIARGGMGIVYRARQLSLNRTVALKMILPGGLASPDSVRRFRTEAEAAARLNHPHIVPIYEIGVHEGQQYFSMRLVEGVDLARATTAKRFTLRQAAELISTVARAVHHAHQHGILHRDLEPANILLDANNQPHVTDFGVAKLVAQDNRQTQTHALLGTPSYMAPEQANPEIAPLSTAVDIYSLGAVLYQLLTGQLPFRGPTLVETLRQVVEDRPCRPRELNPEVDRDLEKICLKCLEKEAKLRYASAAALAEDLDRWLQGEPILARSITPPERLLKWARRRPAVASLELISAAAAVAFGIAFFENSQRKKTERVLEQVRVAKESERRERLAKEQALATAEQYHYFNRINWAEHAYFANNVVEAEQLLDECPEHLRKWEWRYLKRLCAPELLRVQETNALHVVVFTADGKRLGYSSETFAKIVDAINGNDVLTISGRGSAALAIHPKDNICASVNTNHDIEIRDSVTGALQLTVPTAAVHKKVTLLAFSPDGELIASAGELGGMQVWDTKSGAQLQSFARTTQRINSLVFHPNSARLAFATGEPARVDHRSGRLIPEKPGEISVLDIASGTCSFTVSSNENAALALAVAFSLDGQTMASGHSDKMIRLWDASTGKLKSILKGHADAVRSVAFRFDGKRLVSASADQTVRLWELQSQRPLGIYRGHSREVHAAAFAPNASTFVSASGDASARLWDGSSGPEALEIRAEGAFTGLAWATNSRLALMNSKRFVELWDVSRQTAITNFPGSGYRIALAPDAGFLVHSKSGQVALLNLARRRETFLSGKQASSRDTVYGMACSPDGQFVAAGAGDRGAITIWEVSSGKETSVLRGNSNTVWDVTFTADGTRLVSASGDFGPTTGSKLYGAKPGEVRLWQIANGNCIRTWNGRFCVWAVAASPDGKLVGAGSGPYGGTDPGAVQVWDVDSGRELFSLNQPDCVFSIAFSPDGARLATAGGKLGAKIPTEIRIWELRTGRQILSLRGHSGMIDKIEFSRDGRWLASASEDGSVRIWDTDILTPEQKIRRRQASLHQ